jgi:gas vesicle protein
MLKFLSGLSLGIGLGLLFTPASGEETRRKLRANLRQIAHAPERKVNEVLDTVPEKAAELASEAARKAAQQAVDNVREKTGLRPSPTGTQG